MLALLIIGLIAIVIGIVVSNSLKRTRNASASPMILTGAIILGVVLMVISCVRTVPTGHTGIVTTFGKVEETTYEAGVHVVMPWKTVINMDNRNQKASRQLILTKTLKRSQKRNIPSLTDTLMNLLTLSS